MAVDTPAKIAIIGAGPIGLEVALYARFLGYDVVILERGQEVGAHVARWGGIRMLSPFANNHSSLGVAAIQTHDESYVPPGAEELLTGKEWQERYLKPLAATDLLADHLRLETEVTAIGKYRVLKGEMHDVPEREDYLFRILCRRTDGSEFYETADVVIDSSGILGCTNWLGEGGIPAIGEQANSSRIERGFPDICGSARERYAGQHTVLVGSGLTAATHAIAIAKLAAEVPGTTFSWITRSSPSSAPRNEPLGGDACEAFPEVQALAQKANAIAKQTEVCQWISQCHVQSMESQGDGLMVSVEQEDGTTQEILCRSVLACVGFRPDRALYRELQIEECPVLESGRATGSKLLAKNDTSATPAASASSAAKALLTGEPHFYLLGSKSHGRGVGFGFGFEAGLSQIRTLFQILGDREDLDLYATSDKLQEAKKT